MFPGKFASSSAGQVLFGSFAGGVTAELTGGNFWMGAVTGATVSWLNHVMHEIASSDEIISEDENVEQPPVKKQPPSKPQFTGSHKNEFEMLYNINKFFLDARLLFADSGVQTALAGVKIVHLGKIAVDANKFHRVIKPSILSKAGKFQSVVGKNPDIMIKGEKIFLTGAKSGSFRGKTYDTGLKVGDFF